MDIKALLDFVAVFGLENSVVKDVSIYTVAIFAVISVVVLLIQKTMKSVVEIEELLFAVLHNTKHDYSPDVHINTKLTKDLSELRADAKADRALIVQFHNGDKSIANNPFLKLTCTHEALSRLATTAYPAITSVPIAMFGTWAEKLLNNEPIAHHNMTMLEKDPNSRTLYQFLVNLGVKSIYVFPLKDKYDDTYGMGMVQYTNVEIALNDEQKQLIRSKFAAFGILLAHGNSK